MNVWGHRLKTAKNRRYYRYHRHFEFNNVLSVKNWYWPITTSLAKGRRRSAAAKVIVDLQKLMANYRRVQDKVTTREYSWLSSELDLNQLNARVDAFSVYLLLCCILHNVRLLRVNKRVSQSVMEVFNPCLLAFQLVSYGNRLPV